MARFGIPPATLLLGESKFVYQVPAEATTTISIDTYITSRRLLVQQYQTIPSVHVYYTWYDTYQHTRI